MSSSSIGLTQWLREVRCWCGEVAPVKMSWSDANPGKRYRACPHYGGNGNCWYFEWIDSDVTERVSRVIRGLLKKLDKKDNEIERLQTAIEKQNGVLSEILLGSGKLPLERDVSSGKALVLEEEGLDMAVLDEDTVFQYGRRAESDHSWQQTLLIHKPLLKLVKA
nr:DNA-(apurinic or apyrimidinic site) lyase [Ipomoea batatas]